ncbi:MAG: hypothetical protein R2706_00500 [Acidimicrobiales bacterium]
MAALDAATLRRSTCCGSHRGGHSSATTKPTSGPRVRTNDRQGTATGAEPSHDPPGAAHGAITSEPERHTTPERARRGEVRRLTEEAGPALTGRCTYGMPPGDFEHRHHADQKPGDNRFPSDGRRVFS